MRLTTKSDLMILFEKIDKIIFIAELVIAAFSLGILFYFKTTHHYIYPFFIPLAVLLFIVPAYEIIYGIIFGIIRLRGYKIDWQINKARFLLAFLFYMMVIIMSIGIFFISFQSEIFNF